MVEAINAGVDLLLVAFDSDQFYRIFGCASTAAQGKLDADMLRESAARLERAFPIEQARAASGAVRVVQKN